MSTFIKTLKDAAGNILLPRTRSTAVTMTDGTTVEDKIASLDSTALAQQINQLATNKATSTSGQVLTSNGDNTATFKNPVGGSGSFDYGTIADSTTTLQDWGAIT
jgi:hypothetical protein